MTTIVYGHFDSAGSLHRQIASFCVDEKGFHDNDRLVRLYGGAIAECLLDYDDWKDGWAEYFGNTRSLEQALDIAQWHEGHYAVKSFILDRDTELGRSLVRGYLDEAPETSFLMLRNIRSSLQSLIPAGDEFWTHVQDMAAATLVAEQVIHYLCDHVIEICMGAEGWTLGDCIQAMSTLSGQYHAKALETQNLGVSSPAVIDHDFDYMVNTMMNEAMRLGMPDHAGLFKMLAANDTQPFIPFHKAEGVDVIAKPLFRVFHVMDSDLKSMILAKATGRMMAVASAGDEPDMDCCVVTPMALASMQGSYLHCLSSSFHS